MKKAFLLIVLIVAPTMAFSQGTVLFLNGTGLVTQWTSYADRTLIPVPVGGGYVQLIAAPEGTPLSSPFGIYLGGAGFLPWHTSLASFIVANPGWVAVATTSTTPIPGRFNGGIVTINGIAQGAGAEYMVIGWTGPYSTYDAAYTSALVSPGSSFLGMSSITTISTGGGDLSTGFAGMALEGFILGPEPSTFALTGLGVVLLVLFRRRS